MFFPIFHFLSSVRVTESAFFPYAMPIERALTANISIYPYIKLLSLFANRWKNLTVTICYDARGAHKYIGVRS